MGIVPCSWPLFRPCRVSRFTVIGPFDLSPPATSGLLCQPSACDDAELIPHHPRASTSKR
jgi:hypothetical protein